MQLPAIRKVTIASKPVPKGDIIAEVEFAEILDPAQAKYLTDVYRRYAQIDGISLAVAINGRRISFRGFGNRSIPDSASMTTLLSNMDIGTVTPIKQPKTRQKPQRNVFVARKQQHRPAVTSAFYPSLAA